MEPYIKKADIVAEIESLKRTTFTNFDEGVNATVQTLLDFLDTLEVKEVEVPVSNTILLYGLSGSVGIEEAVKETEEYKEWQGDSERQQSFIDFAKFGANYKHHTSKDLEEAAEEWDESLYRSDAFKAGAQWQREHLWKPADGDDLPEIDREVIALLSNGKVVYAHRPQEYWDGKNIATGEVTRYYPKRYDKGGWNIPDVKFWLDCELPKIEE